MNLNTTPDPAYYIMLDINRHIVEHYRHGPGVVSINQLLDTLDVLDKLYPESRKLIDERYGRKDNST